MTNFQEEEVDDLKFEEAPYDNYEEHVSVGRIIVARARGSTV